MKITLVHNHYDAAHLDNVINDMHELGEPTIKAYWNAAYDVWVALEGSHRIRAAHALGLVPVIDQVEYDDIAEINLQDLGFDFEDEITGEQINADVHRREMIEF